MPLTRPRRLTNAEYIDRHKREADARRLRDGAGLTAPQRGQIKKRAVPNHAVGCCGHFHDLYEPCPRCGKRSPLLATPKGIHRHQRPSQILDYLRALNQPAHYRVIATVLRCREPHRVQMVCWRLAQRGHLQWTAEGTYRLREDVPHVA